MIKLSLPYVYTLEKLLSSSVAKRESKRIREIHHVAHKIFGPPLIIGLMHDSELFHDELILLLDKLFLIIHCLMN